MDKVESLKRFGFFEDWNDQELEKISSYFEVEHIAKGNILFKQNDLPYKAYFIISGSVELKIMITDTREERLAMLKSSDVFGEVAVICDTPRTAAAVTFIDSVLLTLTKEKLFEFLNRSDKNLTNKLLLNFIKEIGSKLRSVDSEIRHMKLFT